MIPRCVFRAPERAANVCGSPHVNEVWLCPEHAARQARALERLRKVVSLLCDPRASAIDVLKAL